MRMPEITRAVARLLCWKGFGLGFEMLGGGGGGRGGDLRVGVLGRSGQSAIGFP